MDEKTRRVLMIRLNKIIEKMAMQDYLESNVNKQGKLYKRHRAYSLSRDTVRAKELYNILFFDDSFKNLSRSQEEEIKGFLLSYKKFWIE